MKYKRLRYSHTLARPPFCPPSWNLYSELCQTFTTNVRCHQAEFNVKAKSLSQAVFLASTNVAYIYTHDDSIRRNAMRCISPNIGLHCSFCLRQSTYLGLSYQLKINCKILKLRKLCCFSKEGLGTAHNAFEKWVV